MVNKTVRLNSQTAFALRRMAGSQGRSQSELVGEALRQFLLPTRQRFKGGVRYRRGRRDFSLQSEKLLARAVQRPGGRTEGFGERKWGLATPENLPNRSLAVFP